MLLFCVQVLVENGTNAGFQLVSEARDFLLQVSAERSVPELVGHVFAPVSMKNSIYF